MKDFNYSEPITKENLQEEIKIWFDTPKSIFENMEFSLCIPKGLKNDMEIPKIGITKN